MVAASMSILPEKVKETPGFLSSHLLGGRKRYWLSVDEIPSSWSGEFQ
jgi:hypothetical protein